jgi:hypothetical protein
LDLWWIHKPSFWHVLFFGLMMDSQAFFLACLVFWIDDGFTSLLFGMSCFDSLMSSTMYQKTLVTRGSIFAKHVHKFLNLTFNDHWWDCWYRFPSLILTTLVYQYFQIRLLHFKWWRWFFLDGTMIYSFAKGLRVK